MTQRACLVCCVLVLLDTSVDAIAEVPSGTILINALPSDSDNFLIFIPSKLGHPEWLFHKEWSKRVTAWTHPTGNDLRSIVLRELWRADPAKCAWGGSAFEAPKEGRHRGNYNERAIYITNKLATPLREMLEHDGAKYGVTDTFRFETVTVFQGVITDDSPAACTGNAVGESWFVAIPDAHTVVTAESRSDIGHMLRELERLSGLPQDDLERLHLSARFLTYPQFGNLTDVALFRRIPEELDTRKMSNGRPRLGSLALILAITMSPDSDTIPPDQPEDIKTFGVLCFGADVSDATVDMYRSRFFPEPWFLWTPVRKVMGGKLTFLFPGEKARIPSRMLLTLETLFGVRFAEEWVPMPQEDNSDSKQE